MSFVKLTHPEIKIASYIGKGYKYSTIAKENNLNEDYIRGIASSIYHKLDIKNKYELGIFWNCELYQIGLKELRII